MVVYDVLEYVVAPNPGAEIISTVRQDDFDVINIRNTQELPKECFVLDGYRLINDWRINVHGFWQIDFTDGKDIVHIVYPEPSRVSVFIQVMN